MHSCLVARKACLKICFLHLSLLFSGNSDYLLLICCSTMDPLHACARDGDVEGLAKLLDQDNSINVKGAFILTVRILVIEWRIDTVIG